MRKAIKQYLAKHGFEALCPKAVLFDMDGVLYDSMPLHARAWQESMASFGIFMTRDDAYATEGQRGIDTIRQMVRQQQGREISEQEAQAMYDEKTRLFHLMPEAPVMPGARELMQQLRSEGLTIGVVTGSGQRPLIRRLLRDFHGFLDRKHIVTAYDVERGKPFPDPYLKGLRKAGRLLPSQAVVVENAPLGVEAGVAAKIFTICVNTGHLPEELFLQRGADIVLGSMLELSQTWPSLGFSHRPPVSQDERWNRMYQQINDYIDRNERRPSKYHAEDSRMVNWLKHNRKLAAHGLLPVERKEKMDLLEERLDEFRRINQYAYKYPD